MTRKARERKLPDPSKIKGVVLAKPGREIRLAQIDAAETAGHSKPD